ncbi:MAG TPA: Nif11-like leader peptide family natural product precursor [Chloroflexota bacterium]|jgi:predicted ribosomally synthesized peptide with nif11-like leader
MATNTADQLVDRLVNDAQFRESITAAPTPHDKAQVVMAAGYGNVSLDAIQEAMKKRAATLGAGVQVDPERVKRVEELFLKLTTDQELRQALQAATTPEAKRDVLAQAGYGDLTVDDLRAAAAVLAQREELSDEELELVSGGSFDTPGEIYGAAFGLYGTAFAGALIGSAFGPVGTAVGFFGGGLLALGTIMATNFAAPPPSQW